MLLSIKRGEWTLEQVQASATGLFKAMELAYGVSELPEEVDKRKVTDMLMDLMCIATSEDVAMRVRDVLVGKLPVLGNPHPLIGG